MASPEYKLNSCHLTWVQISPIIYWCVSIEHGLRIICTHAESFNFNSIQKQSIYILMIAVCSNKTQNETNRLVLIHSISLAWYDNQCQVIEQEKKRGRKNCQKRNQQHLRLKRIESVHKSVNNASIIMPTRGWSVSGLCVHSCIDTSNTLLFVSFLSFLSLACSRASAKA